MVQLGLAPQARPPILDQIDPHQRISKLEYKRRAPALQTRLFTMEEALIDARVPVVLMVEGWAGTSKIGLIIVLVHWLDPRSLRVYSITPPRTYEMQYPWLYRFWLKTPSSGQIAIFDRSWYREVVAARVHDDLPANDWRHRCDEITVFERQLADNGAIILTFWLHISRTDQRQRLRCLQRDPLTAWQVTDEDRWQNQQYDAVRDVVEDLRACTDMPLRPLAGHPGGRPPLRPTGRCSRRRCGRWRRVWARTRRSGMAVRRRPTAPGWAAGANERPWTPATRPVTRTAWRQRLYQPCSRRPPAACRSARTAGQTGV